MYDFTFSYATLAVKKIKNIFLSYMSKIIKKM